MKSITKVILIIVLGVTAQILILLRDVSFIEPLPENNANIVATFVGGLIAGFLSSIVLSLFVWLISGYRKDKVWSVLYKTNLWFWIMYIILQIFYLILGV